MLNWFCSSGLQNVKYVKLHVKCVKLDVKFKVELQNKIQKRDEKMLSFCVLCIIMPIHPIVLQFFCAHSSNHTVGRPVPQSNYHSINTVLLYFHVIYLLCKLD